MKGGNFHRVLDALDDSLSKQRSASLTTKRSGAPPATKGNQDIGTRKEGSKGELKAEGDNESEQREEEGTDCPHCGGSGKKKGGRR